MSSDNLLEKVKQLREITGVGFKDCKNAIDKTLQNAFRGLKKRKHRFYKKRDFENG